MGLDFIRLYPFGYLKIDPFQEYKDLDDLHISVTSFTFAKRKADFSTYERLIQRLGLVASEFSPFQVRIKGLYSFPNAVYSKAHDFPAGSFEAIKKLVDVELEKERFVVPVVAGTSYIPHLTLAMFKTSEVGLLLNAIDSEPFRGHEFGIGIIDELQINEINVTNLPNHALSGRLAFFSNRFKKTKDISQRKTHEKTLIFTRKTG